MDIGDLRADLDNLHREETFTDMRAASVRRFTPVDEKGDRDTSRPVMYVGETTITALACSHDGAYAYVGNARGQLNSVDLRTQRLFAKYKGNGGSIRSISPHPTEPLIAVAGLDRYLRVYSLETRTCLAAAFMKQALSGCAWDVREPELAHAAAAAEAAAAISGMKKKKKAREEAEDEDLAGEEEGLVKKKKKAKRDKEAVGTEKKKKKKVRRAEEDDE